MTDIIDKAAMALSAGLMLLGIVGMGIVEILVGPPYSPVPMTNEAGEVVATPVPTCGANNGGAPPPPASLVNGTGPYAGPTRVSTNPIPTIPRGHSPPLLAHAPSSTLSVLSYHLLHQQSSRLRGLFADA